jgi:hypothetical protein
MVLKNCNQWLEKGYFTYRHPLPAGNDQTTHYQNGISYPVWYKEDVAAQNKA